MFVVTAKIEHGTDTGTDTYESGEVVDDDTFGDSTAQLLSAGALRVLEDDEVVEDDRVEPGPEPEPAASDAKVRTDLPVQESAPKKRTTESEHL